MNFGSMGWDFLSQGGATTPYLKFKTKITCHKMTNRCDCLSSSRNNGNSAVKKRAVGCVGDRDVIRHLFLLNTPLIFTNLLLISTTPLIFTSPLLISTAPLIFTNPLLISTTPLIFTNPLLISTTPLIFTNFYHPADFY